MSHAVHSFVTGLSRRAAPGPDAQIVPSGWSASELPFGWPRTVSGNGHVVHSPLFVSYDSQRRSFGSGSHIMPSALICRLPGRAFGARVSGGLISLYSYVTGSNRLTLPPRR